MKNIDYSIALEKGDAMDVIPEYTRSKKINLIIMGTVGRSGLKGLLIGNTAETLIRRVGCSILAVKPDAVEKILRKRYG